MESNNNFDNSEETKRSSCFTVKNVTLSLGVLVALGLVTAGSFYLLRKRKWSIPNHQTYTIQRNNPVFDRISSRTPFWIPFFVDQYPYGIIPKPAGNTCTLLYKFLPSSVSGAIPKLSKDRKYIYFYHNFPPEIRCLDVDTKNIVTERRVCHYDKYFALTQDKFISGASIRTYEGVTVPKIRLSNLDTVGTDPLSFTEYESKCESYEKAIVLGSTSDASKVFYACVFQGFNNNACKIFLKDFTTDAPAEDISVCQKSYTPEWFMISPDNQYTVHFGFDGHNKIIEIRNAQNSAFVLIKLLDDNFDLTTIRNVAFSEDGKSLHIINVKDSMGEKEATIRTIDFEKLLAREADYLGPPLAIKFSRN